jgi:hypothetical protein
MRLPGFATDEPSPHRTDPRDILVSLETNRYTVLLPEDEARILARYVRGLERQLAQLRELAVAGVREREAIG